MRTLKISPLLAAAVVTGAIILTASVVYAAVNVSTSQQKVHVLKATLTYQDVLNATDGSATERKLHLANLPADAEIISAVVKNPTVFGPDTLLVDVFLYNTSGGGIINGPLVSGTLANGTVFDSPFPLPVMFDYETSLYISVNTLGFQDFSNVSITQGVMEVYVSYLAH
jgi:hypothetical protein